MSKVEGKEESLSKYTKLFSEAFQPVSLKWTLWLRDPQGKMLYEWANVFKSETEALQYRKHLADGLRPGFDWVPIPYDQAALGKGSEMSDTCLNCHGLIMKPGISYGYAGPVCHCPINPNTVSKAHE